MRCIREWMPFLMAADASLAPLILRTGLQANEYATLRGCLAADNSDNSSQAPLIFFRNSCCRSPIHAGYSHAAPPDFNQMLTPWHYFLWHAPTNCFPNPVRQTTPR